MTTPAVHSRPRLRPSLALLVLLSGSLSLPAAGEQPAAAEEPPTLSAERVVVAGLREGPHHRLAEVVANDGYLNTYTVESGFGTFTARGEDLLRERVKEVFALAELAEVTKSEAFAKALAERAMKPVDTAIHVATQPVETLKGVPSGVNRYFKRTSRKVKKVAAEVNEEIQELKEDEDDGAGEGDAAGETGSGQSTTAKMKETSTKAARRYLGVSGSMREWAGKLGVDPYSTNDVLQRELERVAEAAAVGSFASRWVIPSLGIGDQLGEVNDLVWKMTAADLEVLNEKRLKEMGCDKQLIAALFENSAYSPSRLTGLVAALAAVEGAAGRAALAERAAEAWSEEEAFFFERSAELLAVYHREVAPIRKIETGEVWGGGVTADGTFVMTLALDHLVWTEEMAMLVPPAVDAYRGRAGVERLEMWLAGSVSERAKSELESRGFTVKEGMRALWLDR